MAPGLGSNGIHPGSYINYFSLNVTSGYSKANMFLEIAGVSNLNESETRGMQIAGITNLTGANAFAGMTEKERDAKIKSGFEANLSGVQLAGVANVVINNVFGGQLTGGVNVSKGALLGFQAAGISNVVYKYSFGAQLAGLWNSSVQSMDGFQLSGLMNYTSGELYGVQISLFNKAGYIEGKNSYENDKPTGVQIGFINSAKKMNGFQVGIINYARRSQGTQVGLINIYRGGKDVGTRDGTAIGLINTGDVGHVAVYADELFFVNYEIATGNRKNGRMKAESANKYVLNSLILSTSSNGFLADQKSWAFGYGLKKFYYNRSETSGMTEFRFLSYGVEFLHLNHESKKITRTLSLLVRPKISVGTRLHPKLKSIFIFGAITFNSYWSKTKEGVSPSFLESSRLLEGKSVEIWPGVSAGILIH